MVGKIGVLLGGLSAERSISLKTGEAVFQALKAKNYDVVKIDVDKNVSDKLISEKIDLAFLALHGKYGEDGTIQGLLEFLGIPYTGSGVLASAISIDKIMTKRILKSSGISTAEFWTVRKQEVDSFGTNSVAERLLNQLSLPVVVKAPTQGSSIGISFVHKPEELVPALQESLKYDNEILIEKFIAGKEVTASILGNDDVTALPLIEIVSKTGVYDYEAKYTVGLSEHLIPPRLTADIQEKVKKIAIDCYKTVGCKGLARIDFLVDVNNQPFVIEINTIPGMTETSLFPDAARAIGVTFPDLVEKLLTLALENK